MSRDILDLFCQLFLQFYLYAGLKMYSFLLIWAVNPHLNPVYLFEILVTYFFPSTYTRVDIYASIYGI